LAPPVSGYFSEYFNAPATADALLTLKILGALDHVDVDSALRFISSKQHPKEGGFGVFYGYDGTPLGLDLGSTYYVVRVLKSFDALDRINKTLLVDFVLERYSSSSGAFHELLTEAYGREYAMSAFGMEFRNALAPAAYALPNVISTFLAVSILKDVDALSLINATKTLEWVKSCQSSNGGFKPYPYAEFTFLPGWSSLLTNPFDVDREGAGIPYTYAATSILKALGSIDVSDKEAVRDYVLSSQLDDGRFIIHKDWDLSRRLYYTLYAITTLYNINMLDDAKEAVLKVENYILSIQQLKVDNSWPVPMPWSHYYDRKAYSSSPYGLFEASGEPLVETSEAIEILNATESLHLLDQPTPRALASLYNLTLLSALTSGLLLISSLIVMNLKKAKTKTIQSLQPSP